MNYKAALTLYSPPFRLAHMYLNNTFIVSKNVTNCKKKITFELISGWMELHDSNAQPILTGFDS